MLKVYLVLIFLLGLKIVHGQRPLTINEIEPKIDSIQKDVDTIYFYAKALNLSKKLLNDSLLMNRSDYIVLKTRDTLSVIYYKKNLVLIEVSFRVGQNKPFFISTKNRTIAPREYEHINIKKQLYNYVESNDIKLLKCDDCYFDELLIPYLEGFKYYFLSVNDLENNIPFGVDHIFTINLQGNVLSHKIIHENKLRSFNLIGLNGDTVGVFYVGCKDCLYIQATDISKYRLFRPNWWEGDLKSRASRARRTYFYNHEFNKITIERFPNELH